MTIFKNDKVVLMKEMGNLHTVGEAYEVANITDIAVVLRDVNTKIAIAAVNIDDVEKYFEKPENVKAWTPWQRLVDQRGNTIAFYRTNRKKVQVRTADGFRGEATCNKCDEFNLYFGLSLAMKRCELKFLNVVRNDYLDGLNHVTNDIETTQNDIRNMVKSLD